MSGLVGSGQAAISVGIFFAAGALFLVLFALIGASWRWALLSGIGGVVFIVVGLLAMAVGYLAEARGR